MIRFRSVLIRTAQRWMLVAFTAPMALGVGCAGEEGAADLDTSRPSEFGYQVSPRTVRLIEGERVYRNYCIGCHGPEGQGDGEAARFLYPAPRDFQKAQFKFMSTRFGQLPTDEDLYRSISEGLRGSSMPAWKQLGDARIRAVIEYIKTFSDVWDLPPAPAIPFVTDPYVAAEDKSEAIARGEVAYHGFFSCWNCHPAYVDEEKMNQYAVAMGGVAKETFRDDLHQTAIKMDSDSKTIFAPDFLRDQVKSGTQVRDLYRSIAAGITGTAMPTWIDAAGDAPVDENGKPLASQEDIWAMAYYVQDLVKRRSVKFEPGEVVVRNDRAMTFGEKGMEYVATVEVEEEEFFDE